ncbi:MAG: exosortase/archaeosortase family protein [Planctomycetaceae bacterium]
MLKPFLPARPEYQPLVPTRRWLICGALMVMASVWAFLPVLKQLVVRWNSDPQYSHGFFVPVIAAAIVWFRRSDVPPGDTTSHAGGLAWIAAGLLCYLAGLSIAFDWLQAMALLPVLYGVAAVLGGPWLMSVVWPAILFLSFMVPLPFRFEVAMAQPLQKLASVSSVFVLQTLGIVATRHGNLLNIEGHVLGVAEACSGLRMLVVFFALSTAFAVLGHRSWIHNLILICSAVPIALICNIGRIVLTGLLYLTAGEELASRLFHDFAGWLMMPAALLLMWIEMKYVDLVIDDSVGGMGPAVGPTAVAAPQLR